MANPRTIRRPVSAAAAIILACVLAFFGEPLVTDKVFSPGALLYDYPPWDRHAPDGYARPNTGLTDRINHHDPWRMFNRDSVRRGELPLWNPFGLAGAPHLANYQSAPLYPLSLLATPLPFVTGQLAIVIAHLFAAGLFSWLFFRGHGLSFGAAQLGALSFVFSGALVLWLTSPAGHVVVWLPALMYLTQRLVERPGPGVWLALAGVVALQFFAGHPETSHYIVLMASSYFAFRWWERRQVAGWRLPALYASACVLGTGVAAVQILPFLDYLSRSHLGGEYPQWMNLWPRPRLHVMVAMLFPYVFGHPAWGDRELTGALGLPLFNELAGVYIGVLPVLLAIGTVWAHGRRDRTVRFFAVFAAVALAFFYLVPPVFGLLRLNPLLNASRTLVVPALSNFCLAYLAGRGLDEWRRRLPAGTPLAGRLRRRLLVAALLIVIAVGVAQLALVLGRDRILAAGTARLERLIDAHARLGESVGSWRGAAFWRARVPIIYADARLAAATPAIAALVLLGGAAVLVIAGRRGGRGLVAGVVVLTLADLFVFGIRVNAATDARDVYPSTGAIRALQADRSLFRLTGLNQVLTPTTGMVYGLADARGLDAVRPRRWDAFPYADGALINSNLANPARYPHYRSRVLDLANVTYVLADAPLSGPDLELVYAGEILVYRRARALPRAWLVTEVERARGERDALVKLFAPAFDPWRRAVVEAELRLPPAPRGAGAGTAAITAYAPMRVRVRTTSPHPALLVLADTWDPGWRAFVDGGPRPIHLTNYVFRGVEVPAGTADVEFHYDPPAVRQGAAISIASAGGALAAALAGAAVRRRRRAAAADGEPS
ncbi:MAG: YfhO family protein [Candidatus Rokubacteria bacterium]|nr:YfhO family protein [Candidatus Rokubacteria bacterium]